MKKRKFQKKIAGLKKWNKIVSVLVKNYKKSGEKYDIKEVRKEASRIYKDGEFKNVAPSKIRVKDILSVKVGEIITKKTQKKDVITANQIDYERWYLDESFNKFTNFWMLGEFLSGLSQEYPEIPILIVSRVQGVDNPLVYEGGKSSYAGSVFQNWVEDYRDDLESADFFEDPDEQKYGEMFLATPIQINGQWYALYFGTSKGFGFENYDFGNMNIEPPTPPEEIIEEVKERDKKTKAKKPKVVKPKVKKKAPKKPAKPKKKPLKTKKEKDKEKIDGRTKEGRASKSKLELARLRTRALELLREDFKDGIYTKAEYKAERDRIFDRYKKGGLI